MLSASVFNHKPVAVMGLGRSGLATAKVLTAAGIDVWAWDDVSEQCECAAAQGITVVDLNSAALEEVDTLVLSPGIRPSHPVVVKARLHAIKVIGDLDLLSYAHLPPRSCIGITGTNGKSTTTSLIGHLLMQNQSPVSTGGNLGIPVLELADPGTQGYYVLEVSSFQLTLLSSLTFNISVLLNITPDHLDWHESMEEYCAAKRRIFTRSPGSQTAIIGIDDPYCQDLVRTLTIQNHWEIIPISGKSKVSGSVGVNKGILIDDRHRKSLEILDVPKYTVFNGQHFWQNVAAAYAAATAVGVPSAIAVAGLQSFSALPHRLQTIAQIKGIRYVNDSKATNVEAAGHALACFKTIYWIAGGKPKKQNLDVLKNNLSHLRRAYLIGTAAQIFAEWLEGRAEYVVCSTLERAVRQATHDAVTERLSEACILLSPACSSFDQFNNFEERGRVFTQLVQQLH